MEIMFGQHSKNLLYLGNQKQTISLNLNSYIAFFFFFLSYMQNTRELEQKCY